MILTGVSSDVADVDYERGVATATQTVTFCLTFPLTGVIVLTLSCILSASVIGGSVHFLDCATVIENDDHANVDAVIWNNPVRLPYDPQFLYPLLPRLNSYLK